MTTVGDTTAHETTQAEVWRETMVAELQELGAIHSDRVAEAFLTVPRHLFASGEPLEKAYAANSPVVTKTNEHGVAISSVSAAHIQATMLEQAQLRPGMRVLEIGTGGYNAALIAELVGETGQVTSVDIDPDIVDRARDCLTVAGYEQVHVVLADAEDGVPDHAPYDQIIVTVGAWDIPSAWWDQLSDGGRMVIPFRIRGLTRSVVFERDGDRLVSLGYRLCGFVPMQGIGAYTENVVSIDGEDVGLRIDGEQLIEADRLREALFTPRLERWSGVMFAQPDELELWLGTATQVPGLLISADGPIGSGLIAASAIRGVPAVVSDGSFAYRTKRPIPDTDDFEVGVYAHGPDAVAVAELYVDLIRTWDRDHRGGPQARIEVYPAATPASELPSGRVVDKKHTHVVISWPETRVP